MSWYTLHSFYMGIPNPSTLLLPPPPPFSCQLHPPHPKLLAIYTQTLLVLNGNRVTSIIFNLELLANYKPTIQDYSQGSFGWETLPFPTFTGFFMARVSKNFFSPLSCIIKHKQFHVANKSSLIPTQIGDIPNLSLMQPSPRAGVPWTCSTPTVTALVPGSISWKTIYMPSTNSWSSEVWYLLLAGCEAWYLLDFHTPLQLWPIENAHFLALH